MFNATISQARNYSFKRFRYLCLHLQGESLILACKNDLACCFPLPGGCPCSNSPMVRSATGSQRGMNVGQCPV